MNLSAVERPSSKQAAAASATAENTDDGRKIPFKRF
jgi:hypothetical protein